MQAHLQSSTAARNFLIVPEQQQLPAEAELSAARSTSSPVSESSGLAHDAGNLLGALRLYCDLLEAPGILAADHRHYASELRLIYERSGALLGRLLQLNPDHFAGNKDSASTTKRPFQAADRTADKPGTLTETLVTITPLLCKLASPYAQVTVEVAPRLPVVDISPEALERIACNLVLNAAEAIHAAQLSGGKIQVGLGVVAGRLRLSVEDNGPGMPLRLAAAFLRPAPLPPGTSRGLGHRNVHELARATHGRVGLHVRPGRGTTLCVEWELSRDQRRNLSHHTHVPTRVPAIPPVATIQLGPRGWSSQGQTDRSNVP